MTVLAEEKGSAPLSKSGLPTRMGEGWEMGLFQSSSLIFTCIPSISDEAVIKLVHVPRLPSE